MQKMHAGLLFVAVCTLIPSVLPIRNTFRNYHQELIYPSKDLFGSSLSLDFSLGLSLKKPRIEIPPFTQFALFESPKINGPPVFPLFTPNTVDQRPETVGQIEEYKKALAEEAEEKLKEQQENVIPSSFRQFSGLGSFDLTTKPTHYVNVKSDAYTYKYRV
ncbi:uncharacterized protein LOC114329144 [Diabrotica virgifera virgifera]|uniref:Uncharacterized protein LOC114329144 n=1 Tax=Diabrotica virgifera virgifera TaxID=50390 RepID=A0A6P7FD69_DIAVI|nr:uncharacterized protein LOC114329144 [Diabrotica virgifera virgifera]